MSYLSQQSAVEQVEDFVYLGSVITQDGKCEDCLLYTSDAADE